MNVAVLLSDSRASVFPFRTLTCTCIHLGPATMQAPLTGRQFMSSQVHTTEESRAHHRGVMRHWSPGTHHGLQHTATHCNTLQHTAKHCNTLLVMGCNTLQHTATHCNTLQHTARHGLHRQQSPDTTGPCLLWTLRQEC